MPLTYYPPRKTLFGQHQQYHLLGFTVDRTNLFQGRVEYHIYEAWDEPNQGLLNLEFGDAVGRESGINRLATGGKGYPECVGVERRYDEASSMAIYTYTFEGIASNHNKQFVDFELEFTMEQRQIEQHPNFQALNDAFGPYDSLNRLWPPIVTAAAAQQGLEAQTSGGPVTNPMYGLTSWISPSCMFRITYTSLDADSSYLLNMGSIATNDISAKVSSAFPQFSTMLFSGGAHRNWLKMAPKVRRHGSCVAVIEEYMLSGPLGFFGPMYDLEALRVKG